MRLTEIFMSTVITIIVLISFGGIASFGGKYILHIVSLPGVLLSGKESNKSKFRNSIGVLFSVLGQLLISLTYVAFIIAWTKYRMEYSGVIRFFIWALAFLSAVLPIFRIHSDARAQEWESNTHEKNPHLVVLSITEGCVLISFFLFAFKPEIVSFLFSWLPLS